MGNSSQRAGQAEAHLRPKHDQYRRFNGDEDQNVSATSKVHPKTREQAERHEKDASLEHQTVNVRDSKHSEVLHKTEDQSKNRDGFLSTEDLMSKIEERCKSTTEMIRTIREEGTINANIRKYLNVSLRKTEQELHTYNSSTADVPANSPLDESESVMIKKIESNLHKSILQRNGKMHVEQKEPNEQPLIEKYKRETEEMKSKIETLKMENSNFQTKLDQLMGKVTKLEKENEDWMLRFSKLAGAKLVENNPAVADLSDPDRPLKLGDAYKQLYDDEWSDAFEALQNDGRTEEQAIELLRETLQNVAAFCKKKAEAFIQEMNKVVVNVFDTKIPDDTERWTSAGGIKGAKGQPKITKGHLKEIALYQSWIKSKGTRTNTATDIKDLTMRRNSKLTARMENARKDIAVFLLPLLQKAYLTHCVWSSNCIPEMKPFIRKCLRVSWLMVVQRPPMCFLAEERPANRKVTQVYTPYTRNGPVLDYVVWPALLLREDGEIITKGVAQFKKD